MNQSGATLLELVVTLAVVAVLVSLAIPGFAFVAQTTRLAGATNDLVAALHLSRSEAIKRSGRTVLCASASGVSCSDSAWDRGWIIFHDANKNASIDPGEQVISRHTSLSPDLRVTGNQFVSRYISFVPSGAAQTVFGFPQAGTITICMASSGSPHRAREIILSTVGRVRTTKLALASCP